MKRVLISIFCFLVMMVLLSQCFPYLSYALSSNYSTSDYSPSADLAGDAGTPVIQILGAALTAVQYTGVAIAIIMMLILGAKYLSGGVDDKATVKKNTISYVIAAGIFFGGSVIVTIIKKFALKTFSE